jgi:hypothetical protein
MNRNNGAVHTVTPMAEVVETRDVTEPSQDGSALVGWSWTAARYQRGSGIVTRRTESL